ncbi:MAG: helicase-exonuclease AddAB subunit AddA [Acutalibacteraceae bacterium]|nr:helicase-exonuclease AddAB subunit AddA [Acutalibacteraceae bacterium]
MAFNPTPEQQAAIDTKGNVLVSAAAGSGKTAVLVERVVRLLSDRENPISADRLLIVTFTNAAAAEMRTRIEKRLDSECRANPSDIGLLKQRKLLSSAKICTIDSFCIDLVRENFERAGVSPDFKISEQNSLKAVNEGVLADLLNEYYEKGGEDFFELLDLVGAEYDDGNFSDYILKMYDYSRQLAFPTEWFDSLSSAYNPDCFGGENEWYKYCVNKALNTAKEMQRVNAAVLDALFEDEKAYDKYAFCFNAAAEEEAKLYDAAKSGDWDSIFNVLTVFNLPSIPRANGELGRAAKAARDYILKLAENLKKLFFDGIDGVKKQHADIYGKVLLLTEILNELDNRLFNEYLGRNTFTFHNIEHLALRLLCEKTNNGVLPAAGAEELLSRYDEVMVDEYQDTNDLQDMLFYVLSNRGERLFAVGDVKQSIYGFRGAKPTNFLNKINAAVPYEKAAESDPKKIILGCNFRSRREICEYINYFFERLMTEKTGDIAYDEEERLIPAARYPDPPELPVSFEIVTNTGNSEESLRTEATHISDYIRRVMESGKCIRQDEKTLRKANFSDFAILLRNTKAKAAILAEELRKNGIPVNYTLEGYAETSEVSVFLSLLKIIDNPDSDVELLSVLLSPIFGFTAEDAANIRIRRREGSLYSALVFSSESGDDRCGEVLKGLEKYRILAATLTLPKLISRLLEDTDYLNTVWAREDGERRHNNLLMLISLAEQYTADSTGGIGGFVNFVLRQSENGMKSAAALSGGDTVKIMSIHASKGLQFPVCIIAETAKSFNDNDSRNSALYSADYGIGFKYYDEIRGEKRTTVAREVILDSTRNNTRQEELRLLYVAMTRAQDKLHFTASVGKLDDKLKSCFSELILSEGRADNMFNSMTSYFDWLIKTALIHPDGKELRGEGDSIIPEITESRIAISVSESVEEEKSIEINTALPAVDKELSERIRENIGYAYPYEKLFEIEAKCSVSALANKAESEKYAFSARPAFMSDGGITATERGTATHKIIEFIDFNKTDDIEAEIERLYEWQYISEREAKAVSRKKLRAFFDSPLFARIKASPLVKREMRFLTEVPVSAVDPDLKDAFSDEKVIVQGAVDLCFEEKGEIIVVDFKTDRTDNPADLATAYGEQLSIYAAACEKIFEKKVRQKIIYSFALSEEIEISV